MCVDSTEHTTKRRHNTDDHDTYIRVPCSSLNMTDQVTHKHEQTNKENYTFVYFNIKILYNV